MFSTIEFCPNTSLSALFGSSAFVCDLEHVDKLVHAFAAVASDYAGGNVCLHGMSAPDSFTAQAHDGHMEFRIEKVDLTPMAFPVAFGGQERDRPDIGAMAVNALGDASGFGNAASGSIPFASFDELWLFANKLAERLALSSLTVNAQGIGHA